MTSTERRTWIRPSLGLRWECDWWGSEQCEEARTTTAVVLLSNDTPPEPYQSCDEIKNTAAILCKVKPVKPRWNSWGDLKSFRRNHSSHESGPETKLLNTEIKKCKWSSPQSLFAINPSTWKLLFSSAEKLLLSSAEKLGFSSAEKRGLSSAEKLVKTDEGSDGWWKPESWWKPLKRFRWLVKTRKLVKTVEGSKCWWKPESWIIAIAITRSHNCRSQERMPNQDTLTGTSEVRRLRSWSAVVFSIDASWTRRLWQKKSFINRCNFIGPP